LVVATGIAYHGALSASFVLDDYHYILEHRELGLTIIPRLFWRAYLSGNAAFYRPLATADFAIDRALFGVSAWAFHAASVAWHVGATLALWRLLARVFDDGRVAFVAALVFALHPVHPEAVTGVVGRSEVMAATFVFVGALLHVRERRVAACAMYLLALWCKESGVVLPLVAVLLDAQGRPWRAAARRAWPFVIPLALYAALRVHALAGQTLPAPAAGLSLPVAIDVLGRDLRLLVWPHPLVADYAIAPPSAARVAATLALLAALLATAWRWAPLRLPLAWFALTIAPVANVFVHIGVVMAERLLYLPSVAVCLVAAALDRALYARARPWLANAAVATVALTLGALTMLRNLDWQTPLALWQDTVEKQPLSALAHGNLALSCLTVGDNACAREHLERAVQLDPTRADYRAALDALDRTR